MRRFLNYLIVCCVVILVVINISFLYFKGQRHVETKEKQEQMMDIVDFQKLENEMEVKFSHEYSYLPLELVVEDIKGNEHKLINLLEGNTFVLWYPQHNCSLCFQSSLDQFLDFSRSGGKAIVLSTNLGIRDLFFFKKKYNIDLPCYVVKKSMQAYPLEKYTNPLFFNLTKDMQISNVWMHNPKFEEIAKEYFNMQKRQAQIAVK